MKEGNQDPVLCFSYRPRKEGNQGTLFFVLPIGLVRKVSRALFLAPL
jgi:hypothetical protein